MLLKAGVLVGAMGLLAAGGMRWAAAGGLPGKKHVFTSV